MVEVEDLAESTRACHVEDPRIAVAAAVEPLHHSIHCCYNVVHQHVLVLD